MKNLLLLLLCLVLLNTGCDTPTPTPMPPPPTPASTITYDHADSLIAGNWIMDKTEELPGNGGAMITTYHTDTANCKLTLTLAPCTIPGEQLKKDGYYAMSCMSLHIPWEYNTYLYLNGSACGVQVLTSTNLVLNKVMNSQSGAITRWYLHK